MMASPPPSLLDKIEKKKKKKEKNQALILTPGDWILNRFKYFVRYPRKCC
jgi:hypothetical protein